MIAGIPGTGISGLFYIVSALWMPVSETVRLLRGRQRTSNWRLVFSQVAMAVAILAALGVTGILVDYFTEFSITIWRALAPNYGQNAQSVSLGIAPTLITFGVLFAFLFCVEIIGILFVQIRSFKSRQDMEKRAINVQILINDKLNVTEDPGA